MSRVVITGMGSINPISNNINDTFNLILEGNSGINIIKNLDISKIPVHIAGEVKNFDYKSYYTEQGLKYSKKMGNFVHYAVAGSKQALMQAGIDLKNMDTTRVGCFISSSIGGANIIDKNSNSFALKGYKAVSPFYIPSMIGNMASGVVAINFGIHGANFNVQSACATSNHSIITAYMAIKMGFIDCALAGGSDEVSTGMVAGFSNMRALANKYNDNPTLASRPYDRDRSGFVISEGSGVLFLEDYDYALNRGANILAEVAGIGMTDDATDIVSPHPEGTYSLKSMELALKDAKLNYDQIDYINSHATSTPLGDLAESKAIKRLIKDNKDIVVNSTKCFHGHLVGAAGGIESIISIFSILNNKIPKPINIDNMDPDIPIADNININGIVEKNINVVMTNSFGFGGHNSTIIYKKI